MICPHCHQEFSAASEPANCPLCGRELTAGPPPSKIKAIWPLAALLLPPILTMLSALLMNSFASPGNEDDNVTTSIGLIGGTIGGAACGIMLGLKICRNPGARFAVSMLLAVMMAGICITLCLIGCTFGGYQLNLH